MRGEHDTVFYDGGCGLCHRAVRFLVARDADGSRFVYAPLGGSTFHQHVGGLLPATLPDSIVVLTARRDLLVRSQAVIHLLRRIDGIWAFFAGLLQLVPAPLADRAYDLVAARRARLFSKPDGSCPVVPADLRARFLP
jgi:predicted DCC family thiol-disulfide oxidoreductase YuxK